MKKPIMYLSVAFCMAVAACGSETNAESGTAQPSSKWAKKAEFIDKCAASDGIKDMSKGDAAKAKQICTCMADKVEAKYPEGLEFEAAGKPAVIEEIGAQSCFK